MHDRVTEPYVRTRQLAEMIARVNPKQGRKARGDPQLPGHPHLYQQRAGRDRNRPQRRWTCWLLGRRLSVISFHSLEDRLVKHFIRAKHEKGPEVPGIPLTEAQLAGGRKLKSIGKALKPSDHEVNENTGPAARCCGSQSVLRSKR